MRGYVKMKYYLVEIIDYNDGTKSSPAIYTYETKDEAIARFHKELGGWMSKENVSHILCMVTNSEGGIYKNESWIRPIPIDSQSE